ncbi:MAG TPA: hypothetical protein VKY73_00325 [Polyangiaceae bacterium]|nr:hypothetical protein [Polyangiaceae bacterium]
MTRFFVRGAPPSDLRKPFLAAIRLRAFQPLDPDGEASEASGWCVLDRPFDLEFEPDKVFEDRFLLLGFRIDRFRVPPAMVRAQMADEEARALARSGKNRLSRNERLELRDKIVRRLRKKLAPSTRTVDVVWDLDGGTVLFFSHSKRVLADFCALFEKTFRLELDEDSPYRAALRANLPRALLRELERVEPTSLRRKPASDSKPKRAAAPETANGSRGAPNGADGARKAAPTESDSEDDPLRRIETTRFLGPEFLLWIWLRGELSTASIRLDRDTELDVWLDQQLTLESPIDKNERVTVRGMAPADAEEAREAVRAGKLPVLARIVFRSDERDFLSGLVAPRFGIAGAKVPAVLKEDAGEAFIDRMALCEELFGLLDGLYRAFLLERLSDTWTSGWEPALAAWSANESVPAAILQKLAPPKHKKRGRDARP